jgi:hypothetical protein
MKTGAAKAAPVFSCFSALFAANGVKPRKDEKLVQMLPCIGMFLTSVMLLTSVRYET